MGRNMRLTLRMTLRLAIAVGLSALVSATALAQTHATKKPESVVRAVAVYEWTGDAAKPTASRIVPVSLFINGQFEDAGIYQPRPVPFVLDVGNIFELEKSGQPQGIVELAYQLHTRTGGATSFDDGWTAYGKFKPAAQPVLVAASKKSGPLPQIVTSGGSGPHFSNKSAGTSQPVDRSTAAGSGTTVSADKADEPTLHKKSDSTADTDASAKAPTTGGVPDTTNDPDDPADRPTLKRRTPQERKDEAKKKATASVTGAGDLNDDPDRPTLHRGVAKGVEEIPALKGVPAAMQQMVGVSDARNRPEHDFSRVWENDDEKADVTKALEAMARTKLAAYGDALVPDPTVAPAPAPKAAATKSPQTAAARARAKKAAAAAASAPAPPIALDDEVVRGYTLSYQGAATFVYSASSPGAGQTTRYVTVVAQRDPLGKLQMAMASATDSIHLDRTAWMRLVDAVDADASNRASLLFELRAQSSRQFALYRVIGAKSEQLFVTTTPE